MSLPLSYYTDIAASDAINEWVNDPATGFFEKEILARVGHLFLIPVTVVTMTLDGVIGAISEIAVILTGGAYSEMTEFTFHRLNVSSCILLQSYAHLLKAIRPKVTLVVDVQTEGVCSRNFRKEFAKLGFENAGVDSFFKRHVISRGLLLFIPIICIVTNVADLSLGLIAALFSICTLGYFDEINSMALANLRISVIRNSLFLSFVVNPRAGVSGMVANFLLN